MLDGEGKVHFAHQHQHKHQTEWSDNLENDPCGWLVHVERKSHPGIMHDVGLARAADRYDLCPSVG